MGRKEGKGLEREKPESNGGGGGGGDGCASTRQSHSCTRARRGRRMDGGEITLPLLGSQEQKMYTIMIMEF